MKSVQLFSLNNHSSLLYCIQGWGFAQQISEQITCFLQKKWANEQFAQKWPIRLFAHFWWATWEICSWLFIHSKQPEGIAHGRSFVLSDLSDSLTLLRRHEQNICFLKNFQKNCQNIQKIWFCSNSFEGIAHFLWEKRKWAICLKKKKWFAHLSWVNWANRSHLLICHERPEGYAHICSFVLSDLSKSLTFAHLFWAT